MADSSGLSKTQKKRQRQAAKKMLMKLDEEKAQAGKTVESQDPLTVLKGKLAEAKKLNDHALATKIRQDIWVLQDTSAGHNPTISAAEVNESLDRISKSIVINEVEKKSTDTNCTLSPVEKKIRNLEKKLQQIDALKTKQKNGEKLEQTQINKIDSETNVRQELEEMKEVLASMSVSR